MAKKGQITLEISEFEGRKETQIIYSGPAGKRTLASIQGVEPGSVDWYQFVTEELGPYVNKPNMPEGASS